MLCGFGRVRNCLNDPVAVEAAIWFHDLVYDTHAKDNEEQSAQVAKQVLGQVGMNEVFTSSVVNLILATKHSAVPEENDAKFMIDLDLAILGQGERDFDEYESNIRQEYAWVSDEQFATGRAAILQPFLDRPSIFTTGGVLRPKIRIGRSKESGVLADKITQLSNLKLTSIERPESPGGHFPSPGNPGGLGTHLSCHPQKPSPPIPSPAR